MVHRSGSLTMGGLTLVLSLAGCGSSDRLTGTGPPNLAQVANGVRNGGDNLVVDIVAGDFAGDNLVVSTCSGDSQSSYNVNFGSTEDGTNNGCLIITTSDGVRLVEDVTLPLSVKSGAAYSVRIYARDAAGAGGILHNSDPMSVNPSAQLSPDGFTIHVHATNVPVWRLSGHLSSKRVAQVGTVDVGDLVYRRP